MTTIIASVLFVCINPTWGGCGAVQISNFGTAEACQSALATMRGDVSPGAKPVVVAYCRPPKDTD